MGYTLTPAQKANADLITAQFIKDGITNKFAHTGALSVISKESEFNPAASEVSYASTSNDRIRSIFSKTRALTDEQLTALKADKIKFFNFVYNGIAGNGPEDGYKYRGRGFNQLTGKGNYQNISRLTGIDFVNNPDLLAEPKNAAKAAVAYFVDGAERLKKAGKLAQYNATSLNDFKTAQDSLGAFYHINAGVGQSMAHINADVTGGKAKATSRLDDLLKYVEATAIAATEVVKKNPLTTALLTAGLIVGAYLLYNELKNVK